MTDDVAIRAAEDADLPAILELLESSLGWVPDAQYEAFYRWKHEANPFGASPSWVAHDGGRIVGLRVWLRWRFVRDGQRWDAVRAVDTATHPEYQGRGIFQRLTLSSLDELQREGVAHVFNTPNEQSRPGYLKMGWHEVGTLPVAVRFRSPVSALRAVRARVPADKWSLPTDAGVPALDGLADAQWVASLLETSTDGRIRTDVDIEVLRWRYGFGPLHYRALVQPDGLLLFRLRRRGPSVECVVGHVLARDDGARRRLLAGVARSTRADQVLHLTDRACLRARYVPLPGVGPILTWRAVTDDAMPDLEAWDLGMGDVELF
jgi:GNAT superfamily N-acetyltransferase